MLTTPLGVRASAGHSSLTEIDPVEEEPHPLVEPPRPCLVLVSQASDILTDKHVPGESDTESVGGVSEGETVAVDDADSVPPGPLVLGPVSARHLNDGLASLDVLDLREVFERRVSVMRTFSTTLRMAMQQIISGREAQNAALVSRAWKLFKLLPGLLLFRRRRGRFVPKEHLHERFRMFERGEWLHLFRMSQEVSDRSASRSLGSTI